MLFTPLGSSVLYKPKQTSYVHTQASHLLFRIIKTFFCWLPKHMTATLHAPASAQPGTLSTSTTYSTLTILNPSTLWYPCPCLQWL